MKDAKVVIGAWFGDEGKGQMTNYFVQNSPDINSTINIRFNGGAQAGHTVIHDGYHHVYSHFGAGSLTVPTYLSKHFVVNPTLFIVEFKEFINAGMSPKTVYIDPDCMVTTPFDVFANQLMERHRGKDRHGSVGVGFGTTIQREVDFNIRFRVSDLFNMNCVLDKLKTICDKWKSVLSENELIPKSDIEKYFSVNNDTLGRALSDIEEFRYIIYVNSEDGIMNEYNHGVFEGAQGLLLDQNHPYFPHVTRSYTGIRNVSEMIGERDIITEINYVTRSYITRHGAGPLPNETPLDCMPNAFNIIDTTNTPDQYQGSLRFAPLDINLMNVNARVDMAKHSSIKNATMTKTITCVDQITDGHITVNSNGILYETQHDKWNENIRNSFDYISSGCTVYDIEC